MGIIILITKSKKKKKNCDNSSTENNVEYSEYSGKLKKKFTCYTESNINN